MVDGFAVRRGALDEMAASAAPCLTAALRALPPMTRLAFRGRQNAVDVAGRTLGISLPQIAHRMAAVDENAALWLGPDEWLLLAPDARRLTLIDQFKSALAKLPHALVDISHRHTAVELTGIHAATVLNAGCPLDLELSCFPVNMCSRTLLGKSEIVLWRVSPDCFRIDVPRSYAAYVWGFLDEARREFMIQTAER